MERNKKSSMKNQKREEVKVPKMTKIMTNKLLTSTPVISVPKTVDMVKNPLRVPCVAYLLLLAAGSLERRHTRRIEDLKPLSARLPGQRRSASTPSPSTIAEVVETTTFPHLPPASPAAPRFSKLSGRSSTGFYITIEQAPD